MLRYALVLFPRTLHFLGWYSCDASKDPRHLDRWREAYVFRQKEIKCFKDEILEFCKKRNDRQADQVRIRIAGAVSDLPAADACYHEDCKAKFKSPKNIMTSTSSSPSHGPTDDAAFTAVIKLLSKHKSNIYNSLIINDAYVNVDGSILSRSQLIQRMIKHSEGQLIAHRLQD